MKLKIIIASIIIIGLMFLTTLPLLATDPDSSQGLGCGGNLGPIAKFLCEVAGNATTNTTAKKEQVGEKFNSVISQVIGFLTIVSALWFFFQFIIAGLSWISAGGDKTALENARKKLMNSIIGLTIVVAAWVIVGVIGEMLGLDILNPGAVLKTIGL